MGAVSRLVQYMNQWIITENYIFYFSEVPTNSSSSLQCHTNFAPCHHHLLMNHPRVNETISDNVPMFYTSSLNDNDYNYVVLMPPIWVNHVDIWTNIHSWFNTQWHLKSSNHNTQLFTIRQLHYWLCLLPETSLIVCPHVVCKTAAPQLLLTWSLCVRINCKRGGAQEEKANCNIMNVGGGLFMQNYIHEGNRRQWRQYGDDNSGIK